MPYVVGIVLSLSVAQFAKRVGYVAPVSATPGRTRRLGAPLRAGEKRPLRGWPHDAASAGVCRTPVKHRFGNETE